MKNLITSRQVSQILECTQRNVSHLVKVEKIVPALILENGNFLFEIEDIEYYKKNRTNLR